MSAVNRSQEVSLSDSYVLILQETVKESKALRAQVAERTAREDEVNRKLEHLFSKVEKLCENANNRESSRKRKRSPSSSANVPRQCRNEFRKMYKALSENDDFVGFALDEGIASERNRAVYTRVAESLYCDYGGKEQCPWTIAQLRETSQTYFKSLCDARTRQKQSKTEDHKTACRRQGRKRDKRDHRLAALAKVDWTPTVKDEVREVLNLAYTSSDESSYEYDSDSERRVLACYKTKHLPWERTRLTKVKKCLDAVYEKGLTRRVRQSRVPRELHEEHSDRDSPEHFVEWAVRRQVPVGSGISQSSSTRAVSVPVREDNHMPPLHSSTPRVHRQQ